MIHLLNQKYGCQEFFEMSLFWRVLRLLFGIGKRNLKESKEIAIAGFSNLINYINIRKSIINRSLRCRRAEIIITMCTEPGIE